MRTLFALLIAGACCAMGWADTSYQTSARVTGSRGPIVATHLIKGSRMATLAKDHTTVIDVDKDVIVEIDMVKKQYSLIPFAQMKQALDEAVAKAPKPAFKVSSKATGQTKRVGVLKAKEMVLSIIGADSGAEGIEISVDSWTASVPGYQDVKEFQRKLGEKLGYAFGSGLWEIARTESGRLPEFAELVQELNQVEGAPVQSVIKMGGGAAEITLEIAGFSSGPTDAAKFEVPAGFKKVDPVLPFAGR